MGKGPANLKVEAGCRISGYLLYLGFSELPVLYLGKNTSLHFLVFTSAHFRFPV